MKKYIEGRRKIIWGIIAGVVAVIALVIIVYLFWSGNLRNAVVLIPRNINTQTLSIGRAKDTPTSPRLPVLAPTSSQIKPATPPPSRASIFSYAFFPVLTNLGVPPTIPTSLPPGNLPPTPTPLIPAAKIPYAGKTIVVDLSEQHVYAYENGKLVFSFVASTGRSNSTQVGHYRILDKSPRAYSDPWGFWMPYWMGIYYAGYNLENGFHSLPVLSNGVQLWGSKIGTPITYGCVVLLPKNMKRLYRWAGIGTAVVIRR